MKAPILAISFAFASVILGSAQEETKKESPVIVRTPIEKQLMRAIAQAWQYDFDKSLEIVRGLYGNRDADQGLILRAETAVCAAQAANRLDTWEGSDFGKATPWFNGFEGYLWMKWEEGDDGDVTIESRNDISIEYFDKIIEHSLERLRRVAAEQSEKTTNAEQDAADQLPARRDSNAE